MNSYSDIFIQYFSFGVIFIFLLIELSVLPFYCIKRWKMIILTIILTSNILIVK